MRIGVVYAGIQQVQVRCELDEGSTVADAIERSGILALCPDINLKTQKVGVYGKFVKLDSTLQDGDRVEIYRKITRVLDDEDDDDDD